MPGFGSASHRPMIGAAIDRPQWSCHRVGHGCRFLDRRGGPIRVTQRALTEALENYELAIERRVAAVTKAIEAQARKRADERHVLKLAEKDKQIHAIPAHSRRPPVRRSGWTDGGIQGGGSPRGIVPGGPCAACGRRASIHEIDRPGGGTVELCGWCHVDGPILTNEDLDRELKAAAVESIAWRWTWRPDRAERRKCRYA
jgi:hypothetical protein